MLMLLTLMIFTFSIPLIMIFLSSILSKKPLLIEKEDPHSNADLTLKAPLDYHLLPFHFGRPHLLYFTYAHKSTMPSLARLYLSLF